MPSRASRRAVAAPIPRDAPVTSATCPAILITPFRPVPAASSQQRPRPARSRSVHGAGLSSSHGDAAQMSAGSPPPAGGRLARRLGTGDAVVIGLGSMIGAGVFAAFAPAAAAAGAGMLLGLLVAAVVAYCNATS